MSSIVTLPKYISTVRSDLPCLAELDRGGVRILASVTLPLGSRRHTNSLKGSNVLTRSVDTSLIRTGFPFEYCTLKVSPEIEMALWLVDFGSQFLSFLN